MKIEQRLVARTDLKQTQRQILSPRIIQSIEVLQIPTLDLEALVNRELSENPMLELASEDDAEASQEGMETDPHGQEDAAESDRLERDLEFLERYDEDFRGRDAGNTRSSGADDEDDKMQALVAAPERSGSLQDHLLAQLGVIDLDQCVFDAAKNIIERLDENGYFIAPLESVVDVHDEGALDVAREALEVVKGMDPVGVGAKDTAEALLLQIDPGDADYALYHAVLTTHWDDCMHNRLPKVAKESGYTVDDIRFALEHIATLNLYPGRGFSDAPPQAVRPDIMIEESTERHGEYRARVLDDYVPRLRIGDHYRRLLEQAPDKETRDYIKNKIEAAKALIESIALRQSTLGRVAEELVKRQHDFFESGLAGLRPLKMQDIAEALGLHVSTICRAVADKYAETPQGIYPLKFFFVGGTETADGEDTSRLAVKEQLKHIVDAEDRGNPLSDITIARMLSEHNGIKIARRTVAKYRDQLNIPDSRQRKLHT